MKPTALGPGTPEGVELQPQPAPNTNQFRAGPRSTKIRYHQRADRSHGSSPRVPPTAGSVRDFGASAAGATGQGTHLIYTTAASPAPVLTSVPEDADVMFQLRLNVPTPGILPAPQPVPALLSVPPGSHSPLLPFLITTAMSPAQEPPSKPPAFPEQGSLVRDKVAGLIFPNPSINSHLRTPEAINYRRLAHAGRVVFRVYLNHKVLCWKNPCRRCRSYDELHTPCLGICKEIRVRKPRRVFRCC